MNQSLCLYGIGNLYIYELPIIGMCIYILVLQNNRHINVPCIRALFCGNDGCSLRFLSFDK